MISCERNSTNPGLLYHFDAVKNEQNLVLGRIP